MVLWGTGVWAANPSAGISITETRASIGTSASPERQGGGIYPVVLIGDRFPVAPIARTDFEKVCSSGLSVKPL